MPILNMSVISCNKSTRPNSNRTITSNGLHTHPGGGRRACIIIIIWILDRLGLIKWIRCTTPDACKCVIDGKPSKIFAHSSCRRDTFILPLPRWRHAMISAQNQHLFTRLGHRNYKHGAQIWNNIVIQMKRSISNFIKRFQWFMLISFCFPRLEFWTGKLRWVSTSHPSVA